MNLKPYFSIIIPTLNEERFLPKLLTNLAHQNFKHYQVLVVDAKSKDKTKVVAESFTSKLPQLSIITSPKKNISYQRNLGAKHASGETLLFLDADTQIPPNFLTKVKTAFDTKNPDVVNTWTKADSPLDKDKVIATSTNFVFETSKFLNSPIIYGSMIAIKSSTFKKIGGFNEKISYGEDTHLLQKAIKSGYKYIILRNTYYILSLRRYRQEGTLNTIRKYAQLNLSTLVNGYESPHLPYYPMGGHLFTARQQTKPSLTWFPPTTKKIPPTFKPKKAKSKLNHFLKQLFQESQLKGL